MRVLYVVLMQIAALMLPPLLWLKGRRDPAWRGRIGERFGRVAPTPEGVAVWIHAVSVGEVMAAMPLIRALVGQHGEGRVCVTTTTPTGSAQVQAQLGRQVLHYYAPIDTHAAVTRFLDRLQPRRVVVMETELWPTLFRQLRRRGIPLILANARLSPRSVKGYGRVAGFARSVLSDVTWVAAQSESDAERYRRLGAPHVKNVGNLKFEVTPNEAQCAEGRSQKARWGDRPIWIAASTHEGEESAALTAHQALMRCFPHALLVLVPRHPQRFTSVQTLLEHSGLSWCARTDIDPLAAPPSVLLGNSMGEMWFYLALADIAFVGGSLVPVGGHNVLEPAALGLPVLFGPYMHNFMVARDILLNAGGATQINDATKMADTIVAMRADPTRAKAMGRAAQSALAPHEGALTSYLTALQTLKSP